MMFFKIFLYFLLELYEYCLQENIADKNLIAKWKKQGYENLCCLRCIQTRDTNFGTSCICRVPKSKLEEVSFNFSFCIFNFFITPYHICSLMIFTVGGLWHVCTTCLQAFVSYANKYFKIL